MDLDFSEILHLVAQAIEVAGVGIISLGGVLTLVNFMKRSMKDGAWAQHVDEFRTGLAKAIFARTGVFGSRGHCGDRDGKARRE